MLSKDSLLIADRACIASQRFIVIKKVANEFIEKFMQKTEKLKVDLLYAKSLENMEGIVKRTVKEGAELIAGGERIKNNGYFFSPTILKNVSPNMEIAQEEVFGPVAPIITVDDENEAIRIANDSKFGLGASIWTQNLDKLDLR
jgi:acyl-CoA reductase-like NAD-dependent aldehyde dehydrogenase